MINLRVGFPPLHAFPLLGMFLLQVPRINGMKYRINFFALGLFPKDDIEGAPTTMMYMDCQQKWNEITGSSTIVMQSCEN